MTTIQAFNQTITYLESRLAGDVDPLEVERRSGYSFALFSRLFPILTGVTLQEYLRQRRLSLAAIELRETDERVIDLALKYGYSSPDSFAQAFKRYHGHTPSEVREGKSYEICSQLQLTLQVQGGRQMEVRIERKDGFRLAGLKRDQVDQTQCPLIWNELMDKYDFSQLIALGSGQSYGMCLSEGISDRFDYMAAFDVKDLARAKELGLDVFEVAPAEYAIVAIKGAIPGSIHQGWKYILEVFFPEHGYRHSGAPDFEVYSEGDMTQADYKMELWVPIEK